MAVAGNDCLPDEQHDQRQEKGLKHVDYDH